MELMTGSRTEECLFRIPFPPKKKALSVAEIQRVFSAAHPGPLALSPLGALASGHAGRHVGLRSRHHDVPRDVARCPLVSARALGHGVLDCCDMGLQLQVIQLVYPELRVFLLSRLQR